MPMQSSSFLRSWLVLFASYMFLASCQSNSNVASRDFALADARQITIGTAGPMSGQYAAFGRQMRLGAEAAVADINAEGGVLGLPLALVVGDDRCDMDLANTVADDMSNSGVVFMAGHFCSRTSIEAAEIYDRNDVLMISPASTNPALTELGLHNVFRVGGQDNQQGQIAGDYIADNYPNMRIAVIHDGMTYGKGLADAAIATLEARGIRGVLQRQYSSGSRDFASLINTLKDAAIDVVYAGGYHDEIGLIVRQMRAAGLTAQLISADSLVTDEFWALSGAAGEGVLMTFARDLRNAPEARSVVVRLRAAGVEPEGYVLATYAAVQVFAQAAEIAGTVDLQSMIQALRGNNFVTVIGNLSFDDRGDVDPTPYAFYHWSDGRYAELQ